MSLVEELRPIPGYEGRYAVSKGGVVFSLPREVRCGKEHATTRMLALREIRTRHHDQGYRTVPLHRDGAVRHEYVHALVAAAFHGPRPEGAQVDHINGVRSDNRAENLVYATRTENNRRKYLHGTMSRMRGEANPRCRLTEAVVQRIREAVGSDNVVARQFGISRTHARGIRKNLRRAEVAV